MFSEVSFVKIPLPIHEARFPDEHLPAFLRPTTLNEIYLRTIPARNGYDNESLGVGQMTEKAKGDTAFRRFEHWERANYFSGTTEPPWVGDGLGLGESEKRFAPG